MPRNLSKSRLMAWRQCPRRLWLEVNRPDLRADSSAAQARFDTGYEVGAIAQRLYDPQGLGVTLDAQREGYGAALERSRQVLATARPVFEAGFAASGAMAFADVMLPVSRDDGLAWRMVEVKSSTSVKDYHRDDVAVQSFAAREAGLPLVSVSVACVDSSWVYPGDGDYRGLLEEFDLTQEAFGRGTEVAQWVAQAQRVAELPEEPVRATGDHCASPFDCGFLAHCAAAESRAEFPVSWLPRVQASALKAHLADPAVIDMRDVPDALLNAIQLRVKRHTLAGQPFFDAQAAAAALAAYDGPRLYFLDFETIQFAVPRWTGTRPYAQIPFQFSLHVQDEHGALRQSEFLDLSGADPSASFAQALIEACDASGAVFVYNAGFETARMKELASRFPAHADALHAICARVVDLLPIVRDTWYHPSQQGSWSIKKVLPAMVPSLRYDQLDGVQEGGAAMAAFVEAVAPDTSVERKAEIRRQLLAYCRLDTYAMVRLWKVLTGRTP